MDDKTNMKRIQFTTISKHQGNNTHMEPHTESFVCPFLGMEEDPETSFLFVSPGNYCHRLKPPKPVSTGYQGSVCFDRNAFVQCPIYKKSWNGKLPEEFGQRNANTVRKQKLTPGWAVLLLLVSLILLGISVYFFVFI